jgi:hypothetical protein
MVLRNVSKREIELTVPRQEVLERLGISIELVDSDGGRLPWRWGDAHKNELSTSSDVQTIRLAPGRTFQLGEVEMLMGGDASPKSIFAKFDVQTSQSCRFKCALTDLMQLDGEREQLMSGVLELRIVDGSP